MGIATALMLVSLLMRWGDVELGSVSYIDLVSYSFRALSGYGGYLRSDYQAVAWALFLYLCLPAVICLSALFVWPKGPRAARGSCRRIGIGGICWCILSYAALTSLGRQAGVPLPSLLGLGFFAFAAGSITFLVCSFHFSTGGAHID